jgi:hypothetical protein
VSALPLPTGGATHVFQIIAVLLALELIAGRDQIWLPRRWRKLELAGDKQQRFITALMKMIRRLERFSRPRLRFLFDHRLSNITFGLLVIGGSLAAFFAPPFTGLDTLPSARVRVGTGRSAVTWTGGGVARPHQRRRTFSPGRGSGRRPIGRRL